MLYEKLRYYSDGIDILRRRLGASIKVRVRVNPLNLAKIHVYDKDEDVWIPCYAIDQSYATGLDLHRHKLYLRQAERESGSTNLEARIRAKFGLHDLIRKSLPDAMGMQSNTLIARAAGIGTHSIFNHLDHQGHLNILASHFAVGHAPVQKPPTLSHQIEIPPSANQTATLATLVPDAAPNRVGDSPPRRRVLPVFNVDKSLRRS